MLSGCGSSKGIIGTWKTEFSESSDIYCYTIFNKDGVYENHFIYYGNDVILSQGYYEYKENSDEVNSGRITIYDNKLNASNIGIGEMNDYNGYRIFAVLSGSMSINDYDTSVIDKNGIHFDAGELIICKELNVNEANNLQAGDVITFQSQNADDFGEIVTHKIRRVSSTTDGSKAYVTYGINTNVDDDTLVTPDYIIGKYVGKLPYANAEKYELSYTIYKYSNELELWKDNSEKFTLKSN